MSTLFSQYCEFLLGPSGAHFLNLGNLEMTVSKALLGSFYEQNPSAGKTTVSKFCNGNIPVPQKIVKYYSGFAGLKRNVCDLRQLTNHCTSIDRLVQAQADIYSWIKKINIPYEYELIVNTFYFPRTEKRELIAIFLAAVLHIVLEMSS